MRNTLRRLLDETDGQDLAEYGMALAVVAALTVSAAVIIANSTRTLWTRALQTIVVTVLGL
jgi:Flp pilus assembly pilin Flp